MEGWENKSNLKPCCQRAVGRWVADSCPVFSAFFFLMRCTLGLSQGPDNSCDEREDYFSRLSSEISFKILRHTVSGPADLQYVGWVLSDTLLPSLCLSFALGLSTCSLINPAEESPISSLSLLKVRAALSNPNRPGVSPTQRSVTGGPGFIPWFLCSSLLVFE